jgi:hypothetical protein
MKEQIDSLTSLAIHARDYAKRVGIEPIDNYIVFQNQYKAYCADNYRFFSIVYEYGVRVNVSGYNDKTSCEITFGTDLTEEQLQEAYNKGFTAIFEHEKNQAEVLEKQKIAQIAELESKLARLRDL